MSDYLERKKQRTEYYNKFIAGKKLKVCSACSGSGYYDDNGSPKCGACNGTGKVREH
jgi:DnaJ-class molecular chaperone